MEEIKGNEKVIMYGTQYCPMVRPVAGLLERAHVAYEYVDIGMDMAGKEVVLEINNGYASVPTLVFPDGTTMTEPSRREMEEKLKRMGYETAVPNLRETFLENKFYTLLGIGAFLFGLYDGNAVFMMLGLGILAFILLMTYVLR